MTTIDHKTAIEGLRDAFNWREAVDYPFTLTPSESAGLAETTRTIEALAAENERLRAQSGKLYGAVRLAYHAALKPVTGETETLREIHAVLDAALIEYADPGSLTRAALNSTKEPTP